MATINPLCEWHHDLKVNLSQCHWSEDRKGKEMTTHTHTHTHTHMNTPMPNDASQTFFSMCLRIAPQGIYTSAEKQKWVTWPSVAPPWAGFGSHHTIHTRAEKSLLRCTSHRPHTSPYLGQGQREPHLRLSLLPVKKWSWWWWCECVNV